MYAPWDPRTQKCDDVGRHTYFEDFSTDVMGANVSEKNIERENEKDR